MLVPVNLHGQEQIALGGERGAGKHAIVDAADLALLRSYRWSLSAQGYAVSSVGPRRAQRKVVMHKLLCPTEAGYEVDHINGDKLDNRRTNLRPVTRSENCQNRTAPPTGLRTGVRNVERDSRTGLYFVRLRVGGRRQIVGWFRRRDDASVAADHARASLLPFSQEALRAGGTPCR